MQNLRERASSVNPLDIFLLQKQKLMRETSLIVDKSALVNSAYCEKWLKERKNDKSIKTIIDQQYNSRKEK